MRSYVLDSVFVLRFMSDFCREKVDREQDEQEFENDIMAEVSELQAEAEEDYQRKMSEYRRQHEEWKSWKRKQVLLL